MHKMESQLASLTAWVQSAMSKQQQQQQLVGGRADGASSGSGSTVIASNENSAKSSKHAAVTFVYVCMCFRKCLHVYVCACVCDLARRLTKLRVLTEGRAQPDFCMCMCACVFACVYMFMCVCV